MIRISTLLLVLALPWTLAACAAPTQEMADHPSATGATAYHTVNGALIGCTRTGFDTICKSN
jgi:hypothetical protein